MGKLIGTKQFAELAAAVIRNLPRDINPYSAQHWIVNQDELEEKLRAALFVAEYEESTLPTEITVGGRVYEILSLLRGGQDWVSGSDMVERAKEMLANLGEEDGRHFLEHQKDIPTVLRNKIVFVFSDWQDGKGNIAVVKWVIDEWCRTIVTVDMAWTGPYSVLRRKAEKVAEPELPTEITVGGVTYEVVSFLQDGEDAVRGTTMISRARTEWATVGQKDGEYILANQGDIPAEFDKIDFVCADWMGAYCDSRTPIAFLSRQDNGESESRWRLRWRLFSDYWGKRCRLLRHKAEQPAEPELPTEMTIGGVTYELLEFVGAEPLESDALIDLAKAMQAISSQIDAPDIFSATWFRELPAALRRIVIVFPEWRNCLGGSRVACFACVNDSWGVTFVPLDQIRGRLCRFLRRKLRRHGGENAK